MRLFSRTRLKDLEVVETNPVAQVALVGAVLIFAAALLLTPILKTGGEQPVSSFDDMLCSVFPDDICQHLARLTEDEKKALAYLAQACEGGAVEICMDTAIAYFEGDASRAATFLRKACEGDNGIGCSILGRMYFDGLGVTQGDEQAVALYRQACEGGDEDGCKWAAESEQRNEP